LGLHMLASTKKRSSAKVRKNSDWLSSPSPRYDSSIDQQNKKCPYEDQIRRWIEAINVCYKESQDASDFIHNYCLKFSYLID
jgi:hypothetical protein